MAHFLFFFLLLPPFLIHQTNAEPRADIIARICSTTKVKNGAAYLKHFWEAIAEVEPVVLSQNFGVASAGKPPTEMFVMAQCHDDLSKDDCKTCYLKALELLPGCFPHVGGMVYMDGCFLRATNYSFFLESITIHDTKICGSNRDDREDFENLITRAIKDLVKGASEGFGTNSGDTNIYGPYLGDTKIYVLANCWKTLDKKSCSACLNNAASSILSCIPATEGRVLNAGCMIRYSDYDFINGFPALSIQRIILVVFFYMCVVIVCSTLAIYVGVSVGKRIYNRKSNRHLKLNGVGGHSSPLNRSLKFKYSTLEKATGHFGESHKLGQGGFGEVFKGSLGDGREIAVKRLYARSNNKSEDVHNEVNVISRVEHKNLVRFLGCCLTSHDNLLVYEFLPNKSLDRILFDPEKKKELDWKKRLGIIIGTAEALQYLHNECGEKIVHRDIKASNILLDVKYRPKIADFGLAKFYEVDCDSPFGIAIAGTIGYMAPEYLARGELTEKVDVYSYGVVMLEIISGAHNNKFKPEESLETLVTAAWKHFQSNTIFEIIDGSLEIDNTEEVIRVVQVGLLCTQEVASLRPTMGEIIEMLTNKDVQLAQPSKPPFLDETMEHLYFSDSSDPLSDSCKSQNWTNEFR